MTTAHADPRLTVPQAGGHRLRKGGGGLRERAIRSRRAGLCSPSLARCSSRRFREATRSAAFLREWWASGAHSPMGATERRTKSCSDA
jgi:hypothetical protein